MNEKGVDPLLLHCDTVFDTYRLHQISKENLQVSYSVCRQCQKAHMILNHVHEDFGPKAFIDIFVRCSFECASFVRIRVRAP